MVNEKQTHEIAFWQQLKIDLGPLFRDLRIKDRAEKTKHFQEIFSEEGHGLDLGSGPLSIFEFTLLRVTAVDPLMDEYVKIFPEILDCYTPHFKMDGEALEFPDGHFDFVFCCNVIDHTPNPEKMVAEIWRVLKPGGKLYFQVNFDDNLAAPHYALWTDKTVKQYLEAYPWKCQKALAERNEKDKQTIYNAIYVKPKS